MSNLIAIAYPDVQTAEQVRSTLGDLKTEKVIVLEDMVVVTRDDKGKVKLHQAMSPGATGAAGGAVWGGLIGKTTDIGVDDKFMKDLGAHLEGGKAALIVLVRQSTPDKVLPRISEYGG